MGELSAIREFPVWPMGVRSMWRSYLTIAIRRFMRDRVASILNILGLGTGFATVILVVLFLLDELSYDRHWPNHQNIYRISAGSGFVQADSSPPDPALWMKLDFSSVEHAARILPQQLALRVDEIKMVETVFATDPEFF